MIFLLLILGIIVGCCLYVATVTYKGHPPRSVPVWCLGIAVLILLLGIAASGSVLGKGNLGWIVLAYIGALGLPLLVIGTTIFGRYQIRWNLLVISPVLALYLARCWVDLQTYRYGEISLAALQSQISAWNRQADLSNELSPDINPSELIVYHWNPHLKRIGLTDQETGDLTLLVDFSVRQDTLTIQQVIRVNYLTTGDLMVWPSR